MIAAKRLREVLSYDPDTGEFRWLVDRGGGARTGDVAGNIDKSQGYRVITIDGSDYRASRLAFLWMIGAWPKEQIDHVNLDRADDSWKNLREATCAQNCANRRIRSDNTTGFKGVCFRRGKYEARISVNGKRKQLGTTDDVVLASYLYKIAAAAYHGEFARFA